jgi:hypothetical protein
MSLWRREGRGCFGLGIVDRQWEKGEWKRERERERQRERERESESETERRREGVV